MAESITNVKVRITWSVIHNGGGGGDGEGGSLEWPIDFVSTMVILSSAGYDHTWHRWKDRSWNTSLAADRLITFRFNPFGDVNVFIPGT